MKITLKAMRVNAELTQAEAAKKVGVSKVTINSWENNKTYPNVVQLKKLCELYGCSVDDIFLPSVLTLS